MSKQDSHFANMFSVVLGLLVTFTILMFALARYVGSHTQRPQVLEDDMYVAGVQARTQLPVRLAIAGQDNSVLTIEPPAGFIVRDHKPLDPRAVCVQTFGA